MENSTFYKYAQSICEIYENYPVAKHSTFRIGGNAELAAFPKNGQELCGILSLASAHGIKARVIGNASNILFSSDGISGMLVFTEKMNGIVREGNIIRAECGAKLSALCNEARKHGLGGAEFAFGIPGTVGGAIYMNAGAHGGEIADILTESVCFDRKTGKLVTLSASEHCFGYRKSVFEGSGLTVLSSSFALCEADPEAIAERMRVYTEKRKASQPLTLPSAGSVFKRPAVGFAGKYIEDAGLKGLTVGGAQVSEKHAGFIVNIGGADSHDVLELIDKVKTEVSRRFGVLLETEIIYID